MSWTYGGNPAASALAEVRFLISDTIQSKPWSLQDEEINYTIGLYSDSPPVIGRNFLAAAVCAESILASLKGSLSDKAVGDLRISANPTALAFFDQTAKRLRMQADLQGVVPWVGGTSVSEKAAADADPDRVQPAFKVNGMDKVAPLNQEAPEFGF